MPCSLLRPREDNARFYTHTFMYSHMRAAHANALALTGNVRYLSARLRPSYAARIWFTGNKIGNFTLFCIGAFWRTFWANRHLFYGIKCWGSIFEGTLLANTIKIVLILEYAQSSNWKIRSSTSIFLFLVTGRFRLETTTANDYWQLYSVNCFYQF